MNQEVRSLSDFANKPDIPDEMLAEWQRIVDLMAELIGVPAGLIMKLCSSEIEVFIASVTEGNPYKRGERANLNTGLYCEMVMAERDRLLIPDASKDPQWDHNPDLELGMVSYLGFPLVWPDGEVFGTLCVLDTRENLYSSAYQRLMRRFKATIETNLKLLLGIAEHERAEEKLRKLSRAIEQSPSMTVITDTQGNIEYTNPKFTQLTGYTAGETQGQNPRLLQSGEQTAEFYREFWDAITSGGEWRGEWRNRKKDGELYWEFASVSPIRDAEGEITHFVKVAEDITARVQAEEALKRRNRELALLNRVGQKLAATLDLQQVTEQLLQAITETIDAEGASVWLWDDRGEEREEWLVCQAIAHAQNRSLINLRLRPGQGIAGWVAQMGKSVIIADAPGDSRFFPGIDEQIGFRTRSLLAAPLRVRDAIVGVLEVVNKQGGEFDTDDLTLVETLAASAAIAIDNARLVEALRQHSARLEARNEELDAFAHTAAHDLKGPLAPMVGYAETLAMDYATALGPDGLHYLHKIAQSGRKMSNIIDELLLLAEARKTEVDVEPLDMASIVLDVQQRLAFMIEGHQAEIILPDASAWPTALGYSSWVEEVWVNYISNGIQYGGRPPRVELGASFPPSVPPNGGDADAGRTGHVLGLSVPPHGGDGQRPGGEMVRFWVRDNGPGLSPEEQARLFTPFTRLGQTRAKGHGLGLSIVRRIVEKLGGQVGVESEMGAGSLFWFTLPAK